MAQPKKLKRVLWLGYGDIAARTCERLAQDVSCIGVCRNPGTKNTVAGVTLVAADAGNEHALSLLIEDNNPDIIIVSLTPAAKRPNEDVKTSTAQQEQDRYHRGYVVPCRHLQHRLGQDKTPRRVIYISSTGVYGQRDGEWVDETSVAQPSSPSGQALLQAEQVIASANARVTRLRCSGIYGPGRDFLIRQLMTGNATATPAWTNRIHVEDVAGFIHHLVLSERSGNELQPLYLLNDNLPVLQKDVYDWLAEQLQLNKADISTSDEVGPRGSKRCRNALLKQSGYSLSYPTFKDGYSEHLAALDYTSK